MHEDLLERRLGAALREEADALPFTITAAELERRMALRRRSFAGRRLTLLLAAAVGIGLFGVGGALSGLLTTTMPAPTQATAATFGPQPTGPDATAAAPMAALPSLDSLIAEDPSSVAFAATETLDRLNLDDVPGVRLGKPAMTVSPLLGAGHFDVAFVCSSLGSMSLTFEYPENLGGGVGSPSPIGAACDGAIHRERVAVEHPSQLIVELSKHAAMRLVVRYGSDRGTRRAPDDPALAPPGAQQELIHVDDTVVGPEAVPWGEANLQIERIGELPERAGYHARIWCEPGTSMRVIIGREVLEQIVSDTESHIGCDGVIRDLQLAVPEPDGANVYVAAEPGAHWSALVSSDEPPISLSSDKPGWHLAQGIGPEYTFAGQRHSISGEAQGYDEVWIVVTCINSDAIDVTVEDGSPIGNRIRHYHVQCKAIASITGFGVHVTKQGVGVSYFAPQGSWTALAILVPDDK